MTRREDHLEASRRHARRTLQGLSQRWPAQPGVFLVALLIVVLVLLWIAL